ncbi:MAG: hypothetical protein ABFS34_00685 [Gemmatimonadota bacterium]
MSARRRRVLMALGLAILTSVSRSAAAQEAEPASNPSAAYLPQADTLWYEKTNPFRLYWVRGADTLGWSGDNAAVEAHVWTRAPPAALSGIVAQHALDAAREVKEDTFLVAPTGRVLSINGPGAGPDGRWDLLPPLPGDTSALVPGAVWRDSLSQTWEDEHGSHRYAVTRRLEVWEVSDSLGGRIARIRSEGEVDYRDAFLVDSALGLVTTMAVSGPVEETFLVDVAAGRMVSRSWSMRLLGSGTIRAPGEPTETLPAGLISRQTLRLTSADRAALLARPLPGRDTTFALSFADGRSALHTAATADSLIVGGQALTGGRVSTVELRLSGAVPEQIVWRMSAPLEATREVILTVAEGAIADEVGAPLVPPPSVAVWGFWLEGHEELLTPLAFTLPVDSVSRRFAVWDLANEGWLEGEALILDLEGSMLAVFAFDGPLPVLSVLVSPGGELLYAERGTEGERAPPPGGEKRAMVEELLRRFTDRQEVEPAAPGRRS